MTFSKKIDDLFEREKWAQARRLLQQRLKEEPNGHWLLTRLGTTYYEEGDYKEALRWSLRAYQLAPKCPLVLWDLASTHEMRGDDSEALKVYRELFQLAPEGADAEACSEGPQWFRSLLTDCFYSVAGCFFRLGEPKRALWFIRQHLEWRMRGAKSIYPAKDARALMRQIVKALPGEDVFIEGIGEASRQLSRV